MKHLSFELQSPSLSLWLAVTVLVAVQCSPVQSADEVKPSQTLTKGIIAKSAPASTQWKPPIRLPGRASAKGWIGRLPKQKPRKTRSSTLPPPAPPTEPDVLFPSPSPPVSIRRLPAEPGVAPMEMLRETKRAATLAPLIKTAKPLLKKVEAESGAKAKLISQTLDPAATANKPELNGQPSEDTATTNATPQTSGDSIRSSKSDDETAPEDKDQRPAAAGGSLNFSRPLTNISLSMSVLHESPEGDPLNQPEDRAAEIFSTFGVYRESPLLRTATSRWNDPSFYNPLYFEDPNLERCGVGCGCFTELVSAVRFFGRAPVVPYMIGANPPRSCVRSLGNCPTCHVFGCDAYLPPLDCHGTALQTAATVGLIFLLP